MLTELCQELRYWFERKKFFGTFTIESGQIDLPDGSLQSGQYFRIVGSVFNDGVHKYDPESESQLVDEVFEGAIWSMAVPPAVVDLSGRINTWVEQYGDSVSSPYQSMSEAFGDYSRSWSKSGSGMESEKLASYSTPACLERAKRLPAGRLAPCSRQT